MFVSLPPVLDTKAWGVFEVIELVDSTYAC